MLGRASRIAHSSPGKYICPSCCQQLSRGLTRVPAPHLKHAKANGTRQYGTSAAAVQDARGTDIQAATGANTIQTRHLDAIEHVGYRVEGYRVEADDHKSNKGRSDDVERVPGAEQAPRFRMRKVPGTRLRACWGVRYIPSERKSMQMHAGMARRQFRRRIGPRHLSSTPRAYLSSNIIKPATSEGAAVTLTEFFQGRRSADERGTKKRGQRADVNGAGQAELKLIQQLHSTNPLASSTVESTPLAKGSKSRTSADIELKIVHVEQPPVPRLCHGLDRVLFMSGVYQLQDPRTKVFNFDPYLQKILPPSDFNFAALAPYMTSSKDPALASLADYEHAKFFGSTSSLTGVLKHFHFLLSQWRLLNLNGLSREIKISGKQFSESQLTPSAIFLNYKDGRYAIDADKSYDFVSVMSLLGHSLEKLLTVPRTEFEKYKLSSDEQVDVEDNAQRNSYHYTAYDDLLMRSQLDGYDPRLPGTGIFDIKTRAVVSIRAHAFGGQDITPGLGYEVRQNLGTWESYEREYYDMARNTMLSYSLQARMGRMDGIFAVYHNIERIFGFQYLSLEELDNVLHGQRDRHLGDQEFKLSLSLMKDIFGMVTREFPETSIRLHFETRRETPFMYIFAEPLSNDEVESLQTRNADKIRELTASLRGRDESPDDEDAAWDTLRAKVDAEISKDHAGSTKSAGKGSSVDDVEDHDEEDAKPSFEYRLLRLQIVSERLKTELEGLLQSQSGLDVLQDGAGLKRSELNREMACLRLRTNFYKLRRKLRALRDDIGEELGESSKLLGFAEHTQQTINKQLSNIGQVAPHLISAEDIKSPSAANKEIASHNSAQEASEGGSGQVTDAIAVTGAAASATEPSLDSAQEPISAALSRRLMALTLILRNKVNGKIVQRPGGTDAEPFTAADEWTIDYHISAIDKDEQAWTLYEQCKRRREEGWDPDSEVKRMVMRRYREAASVYAEKGREFRREEDLKEERSGGGTVVFDAYDSAT